MKTVEVQLFDNDDDYRHFLSTFGRLARVVSIPRIPVPGGHPVQVTIHRGDCHEAVKTSSRNADSLTAGGYMKLTSLDDAAIELADLIESSRGTLKAHRCAKCFP